jgi:hypothetical protein
MMHNKNEQLENIHNQAVDGAQDLHGGFLLAGEGARMMPARRFA